MRGRGLGGERKRAEQVLRVGDVEPDETGKTSCLYDQAGPELAAFPVSVRSVVSGCDNTEWTTSLPFVSC